MSTQTCSGKKYSAYPEYKDSGVALLGSIPSHWAITRIKHVSELTPKKPDINRELKCSFLPMEKLKTDSIVLDEVRSISDVYDGYTYFADEDILMAKVTPCFENKNIAVAEGLVNQLGFGSSEIYVLRTNLKAINRYLFYRLQEDGFMDVATAAMTGAGGLKRVPSDTINNFISALPCIEEQHKIANFLDHETAKIDTLIYKQQQLIKLLKEKRQAVISHAVTKGLNQNVSMKDSGVTWLGKIPEHWELTSLKHISILNPKKSEVSSSLFSMCSFIPMDKLKTDTLVLDETKTVKDVFDGYTYFRDDDILMAKVTPCFENKNIAIAKNLKNGLGFGSSEIYVIRANNTVHNQFLYYRLQEDGFMEIAAAAMTGAGGLKRVPSDVVSNFKIALPPLSEQLEIKHYINRSLSKFDSLIFSALKTIELIQERRSALISAAVTGKIDVRNWQPKKQPTQANAS